MKRAVVIAVAVPIVSICIFLASSIAVIGCYSGLLLTPTTDVAPCGSYSLEWQNDRFRSDGIDSSVTFVNTEYGFASNMEFGVDFDTTDSSDTKPIGNAKYAFEIGGKPKVQTALGFYNAAKNCKSIPYCVAGKQFGFGRMHLGAMRLESSNQWFAGFDRPITKNLTFMADYTSGMDNFWSVAANFAISDHASLLAGVGIPNNRTGDSVFSIHWVLGGGVN